MTRCELWIRCTVTAYCQARLKSQVSNSVGHSAAYYLNVRTFPVSLRAIYTKSRLFNYKIIATNTGVWMKWWICANGRRNSKPVGYFFFSFFKDKCTGSRRSTILLFALFSVLKLFIYKWRVWKWRTWWKKRRLRTMNLDWGTRIPW